jgi:hypothetical protein
MFDVKPTTKRDSKMNNAGKVLGLVLLVGAALVVGAYTAVHSKSLVPNVMCGVGEHAAYVERYNLFGLTIVEKQPFLLTLCDAYRR